MTREERENAIRCLKLWIEREPQLQTYKTCLEALQKQERIEEIINTSNMIIQEDVIKYKLICEVINK